MSKSIGGHQKTEGNNDEWLTPPHIIQALGPFDLDPCSPVIRPWPTAKRHFSIQDDGLFLPWEGRVFLNPPYNRYQISDWLKKMALHGNGITLMFARTETEYFQNYVFPFANSMLFLKGRLTFLDVRGVPAPANGGAPSVLISYGENNSDAIEQSGLPGHHLPVNQCTVMVVGLSPSWRSVVKIAITRLNGAGDLSRIYEIIESLAPDKVKKNQHYKEQIRKVAQLHFQKVSKGKYSIKSKASNPKEPTTNV